MASSRGVRALSQEVRHEKIIELLAQAKSIREVAEAVGCSYHTARNDLMDLAKRDAVSNTGSLNDRAEALWVSGGKRPMPVIVSGTAKGTLQSLVLNVARKPGPKANLTPIHGHLDNVYFIATLLLQGGASEIKAEPKQLVEYRKVLSDAMMNVQKAIDIASQLLANPILWNPETMQSIQLDEEFNKELIDQAAERMNAYINEQRDKKE